MVAKRIIPCLDINNGRVVKGVNFVKLRDAGDPIENALFYEREGADELVFLDITASHQKRNIVEDLVKKVAQCVFMPFTVGGGIRSIDDIRAMLLAGADKVSLNTSAVKNPNLISEGAKIFGSQCIVVAIDAKLSTIDSGNLNLTYTAGPVSKANGKRLRKLSDKYKAGPVSSVRTKREKTKRWEVYLNGGRIPTGMDVVQWAKKAESLGAGEILLTSMDADGTKDGFDIALTQAVSSAVKIPVIASGGCGNLDHFYEVFSKTKATAALAASIFHYRQYSVAQVKRYLKKKGEFVRL
ncbi:MAG: imidazole glycerol phosphate synthase subunit HisF [Candidatus Omnitrophica bacterium]|nr:imidazole glycerol phosphate synthase subunit HisF [Candidatus Omnitrophota bacterium]